MKRDAERLGGLPRLHEQADGRSAGDPELVLERNDRVDRRHCDAHPQRQVGRATGFVDDLLQLVLAVERERAAAEQERAADRVTRLHRMHEMEGCVGDRLGVLELGQRGDVEVADAGAIKRADQEWRAVRLVGVRDVTLKMAEEPTRRAPRGVGAKADDRLLGLASGDQRRGRLKCLHPMGPPPVEPDRASCRGPAEIAAHPLHISRVGLGVKTLRDARSISGCSRGKPEKRAADGARSKTPVIHGGHRRDARAIERRPGSFGGDRYSCIRHPRPPHQPFPILIEGTAAP